MGGARPAAGRRAALSAGGASGRRSCSRRRRSSRPSLVFLIDDSSSMKINDEVRGQTRWDVALKTLARPRDVREELGPNLDVEVLPVRHDAPRRSGPRTRAEPEGPGDRPRGGPARGRPAPGGKRVASIVVLSDGANNAGVPPLVAARQLAGPAGAGRHRRLRLRERRRRLARTSPSATSSPAPTVFVKNQLQVRGTLVVRGFANQPIDVEMLVEGQTDPVATREGQGPRRDRGRPDHRA